MHTPQPWHEIITRQISAETTCSAHLFSEALAGALGGGHLDGCDLGDEGQHGLHSQLGDGHDKSFTAGLHLLLQLLLAVYLYHHLIFINNAC